MNDLFKQDDFNQQYELAKEQGDKRFGSPCQHIQTKNGVCLNCLRKVVSLSPLQERLIALNDVKAQEDWQAEEFYNLMTEEQ